MQTADHEPLRIMMLMFCLGDVGGYMGLFVGGSAITICELLDLVILNSILKYISHKKSKTKVSCISEEKGAKDGKETSKDQPV